MGVTVPVPVELGVTDGVPLPLGVTVAVALGLTLGAEEPEGHALAQLVLEELLEALLALLELPEPDKEAESERERLARAEMEEVRESFALAVALSDACMLPAPAPLRLAIGVPEGRGALLPIELGDAPETPPPVSLASAVAAPLPLSGTVARLLIVALRSLREMEAAALWVSEPAALLLAAPPLPDAAPLSEGAAAAEGVLSLLRLPLGLLLTAVDVVRAEK